MLRVLFDSYCAAHMRPGQIIVVDNDNDPEVALLCKQLGERFLATDNESASVDVVYTAQETNTGGAGGFSAGTAIAYERGAEWIWLMDDDVKILPEALERLQPWMNQALENNRRVIQCQRYNFDSTPFYWQYHFLVGLGIPNPIAPSKFADNEQSRAMNTACFEGGLFHRSLVKELGLPDPRFFIYWDDTVYGYLASKITTPILIKDHLMARTRSLDHFKIGAVRKLNDTSDMARYHIMRNRGYMAQYFKLKGDYNPLIFTVGTALTFIKECIRLFIGKGFKSGFAALRRGMRDGRSIRKDAEWQPMPSLD